jgi:NSS family neurotransmitter:Na+ symporter
MQKGGLSGKSFVLTSIGAAVGLGNALRFPGLCALYGGGAFLLVYFLALILIGIPVLSAEVALGRKVKSGSPRSMLELTPKGEVVGWACCVNSTIVSLIYFGLLGWILYMLYSIVPLCKLSPFFSDGECSEYFFKNTFSSGISLPLMGLNLVIWVAVFLVLKGGIKSLSSVSRFTVVLPIVILFVMAVRGLLYENSIKALSALFIPDFSALSDVQLWINAFSQVFFSLSILSGVMPAYGSYLKKDENVLRDCVVIASADFFVSTLSSVVMFTTLYGCNIEGFISENGIMCAFKIYPVALSRMFGEGNFLNCVFGVLFYLSLALMAFQSAISMTEAFLTPFCEKFRLSRKGCAGVFCVIGCLICSIYSTKYAVSAVEIGDHFANYFNILLLGVLECICLARGERKIGLVREINRYTKKVRMRQKPFTFCVKFLAPAVCVLLFLCGGYNYIFELSGRFGGYGLGLQCVFGWSITAFVVLFSVALVRVPHCHPSTSFLRL